MDQHCSTAPLCPVVQSSSDYFFQSQLRELEEKYKHAMVTNAQLDNTKTTHVFQIELLKEKLEEQEETMIEVQREYKDKNRVSIS